MLMCQRLYVAIYLSLVEKWWYMKSIICGGENTPHGGQYCCHNGLFFKGTMFEFQLFHYYERFSHFLTYYGRSKPNEIKC